MIDYPIVFRCCECTVEEPNLEHLERHIWSRHLQKFPFKCAICDFPSITPVAFMDHYRQDHADIQHCEFRRDLEDEQKLRKMVAESIAVQIYEDDESQHPVQVRQQNQDLSVLQPIAITNNQQLMLLPTENGEYEADEEFGLLEDDENVEEMMDEEEEYIDDLGNTVFVGAHDDLEDVDESDYLDDVDHDDGEMEPRNGYQIKFLKDKRLISTINSVATNLSMTANPSLLQRSNDIPSTSQVANKNDMKESKFECEICLKRFKFISKFEEHKRTHMGEKPFECRYCHRTFTQKGTMRVHERRHTGDRPFLCQWDCGKSFISASARKLHEKVHSGERSFLCSVCGRSFTKKSHLMRHFKNLHCRQSYQSIDMVGSNNATEDGNNTAVDLSANVINLVVEEVREEKFSIMLEKEKKAFE